MKRLCVNCTKKQKLMKPSPNATKVKSKRCWDELGTNTQFYQMVVEMKMNGAMHKFTIGLDFATESQCVRCGLIELGLLESNRWNIPEVAVATTIGQ